MSFATGIGKPHTGGNAGGKPGQNEVGGADNHFAKGDVENVSGIETVHVEVEINGLEVRSFTVTNIDYTGLPEQYTAELVTHSLTVRIRGTRENLDRLNDPTTSIRAVADLSGTTATGTMETPNVDIRVDGVLNTGAVGTYRLTFNISA